MPEKGESRARPNPRHTHGSGSGKGRNARAVGTRDVAMHRFDRGAGLRAVRALPGRNTPVNEPTNAMSGEVVTKKQFPSSRMMCGGHVPTDRACVRAIHLAPSAIILCVVRRPGMRQQSRGNSRWRTPNVRKAAVDMRRRNITRATHARASRLCNGDGTADCPVRLPQMLAAVQWANVTQREGS
jgi:hypothetical protein